MIRSGCGGTMRPSFMTAPPEPRLFPPIAGASVDKNLKMCLPSS
jgi:hypothetical protein